MKKAMFLIVAAFAMFAMIGCATTTTVTTKDESVILSDSTANYWVTGQFASWGDAAGDADFQLEAVALNDSRIASLHDDLVDATFIYVKVITLSSGDAGWTMTYKIDGVEQTFNGNLAVKVIKTDAADADNIPVYWAQSPESGEVNNLTPDTLYVSPFDDTNADGEGDWNANPTALAAGTYVAVWAKVDGVLQMGLIAIPALADSTANYWVTGQFASWGDAAGDPEFQMVAVPLEDTRIASLKEALTGATFIYVAEITLSSEDAGWTMTYKIDGVEQTFNGNLAVKVIKSAADDADNIPVYWAQSPESGQVVNLTPDTLYISPFDDTNADGEGDWNANPTALAAGSYIVVWAKVAGVLQLGLIAK